VTGGQAGDHGSHDGKRTPCSDGVVDGYRPLSGDDELCPELISCFVEVAADVVEYLGYLDQKYSKKDGRLEPEKAAKRRVRNGE